MKDGIAIAGSILVDKINEISAYPKEGELTKIRSVKKAVGGCVPNDAIEVKIGDSLRVNVRLVDCVGYFIEGATGNYDDENKPRMVKTPWSDRPMSFESAAEMGTRKVIEDHSTIGIVMTSDGSEKRGCRTRSFSTWKVHTLAVETGVSESSSNQPRKLRAYPGVAVSVISVPLS